MTLRRIAEAANVSVKTASRALNGDGPVAEDTRAAVMKAARAIGYVPDRAARTMRTGRTGIVGLLGLGITDSPFATEIVRGLREEIEGAGAALLIEEASGDPVASHRLMRSFRPDAVVVATGYRRELTEREAPLAADAALVNAVHADRPAIVPDDAQGAALQAAHLLELGHRRIGVIELPAGLAARELRRRGLTSALARNGVALDPALMRPGQEGPPEARRPVAFEAATDLLSRPDRPTALVCSKDEFAVQALFAAAHLGLRVPADVSVIGFDDLRLLALNARPTLTTVALPYAEMGRRAARAALSGAAPRGVTAVPCALVVRGSTAPPGGG